MTQNRKRYIEIMLIIIFLLLIIQFAKNKSVDSYLLERYEDATEILCQEELGGDKYIVFYTNETNEVLCAIIKKQWIGYDTLRISGNCSISKPGYICSSYYEDEEHFWVAWGLITDNNIVGVKADETEMKVIKAGQYSYRLCWITGSGNTPKNYTEKYTQE